SNICHIISTGSFSIVFVFLQFVVLLFYIHFSRTVDHYIFLFSPLFHTFSRNYFQTHLPFVYILPFSRLGMMFCVVVLFYCFFYLFVPLLLFEIYIQTLFLLL